MAPNLLIVGAADMNLTLPMHSLPAVNSEVLEEEQKPRYNAGGDAAASAVALAGLGGRPLLLARVGADVHGQRLLRLYRELGIDTRFVSVDRRLATGLRVILREEDGGVRRIYYPGANLAFPAQQVEQAIIEGAPSAVCLPLSLPGEVVTRVARLAGNYGLPLFIDAADMTEDIPFALLGRAEIFCIGDKDAHALTGTYPVGADSCLKAAVELEKKIKARYYIIKLGERGLFLYDGRYCHMLSHYTAHLPSDAPFCTSFCAVLALAYLRNGGEAQDAGRYALAYNTLLVKNSADPSYLPGEAEVASLMKTN